MKMEILPIYCGGRYLFGFHDGSTRAAPVDGWYKHLTRPPYTVFGREQTGQAIDVHRSYMPPDFEVFCQVLRHWSEAQGLSIGVIMAATSPSQTLGAKYLQEIGFKKGPLTRKNEFANNCQTWLGDFHKDVWKYLSKVPLPVEKKNAKFGAKS